MQTKLPLFIAAIFGSLTTWAAVQLFAKPQTLVPLSADVRSASLSSVVDCAPTAAVDVTNSATVSTPNHQRLVAAAAVQATSDNSTVPKPAETKQAEVISSAQQHQQLVQQLIVPHVTNLAMVLQLPAGQQQQIQALLQEKADADFANWQQVQQQLQVGSHHGAGAELAAQFQQQVQQSSAQYAAQLRKTLSANQFEQYSQYENTLLNMRKQQQVNQLQSRLTQVSNLDEFQRQEISRLTAIAFKTPAEIQLGAVASPYAPSLIETDPDALQQLRSVLTESQLKESGWQE